MNSATLAAAAMLSFSRIDAAPLYLTPPSPSRRPKKVKPASYYSAWRGDGVKPEGESRQARRYRAHRERKASERAGNRARRERRS